MQAQLEATNKLIKVVSKSVSQNEVDTPLASGSDRAEQWLREHRDCYTMSLREIAAKVGCYPADVSRAKKRLKITQ
jgi:hypothetical protein